MRGKQFTYALFELRVPHAGSFPREEALAELTRRYFTTRGPATAAECAWWSGLTVEDAKAGLRQAGSALRRETIGEQTYWLSAEAEVNPPPVAKAHLLPAYDEYSITYHDHSAILPLARRNLDPAVLFWGTVALKGMRVGRWRRVLRKKQGLVEISPCAPLLENDRAAVASAAQRYADFLELELSTDF